MPVYPFGYSIISGKQDAGTTVSNVLNGTDPDAQAFITAAGITDPTQQQAINQLVIDLKAASIWTQFTAIYPFVGGTASQHSYNLVNPSLYQITWNGTVTHNANGITGNGSTGYGSTGMARNILPVSLAHMAVYLRTAGASAFGAYIGVDNFPDDPAQFSCMYQQAPGLNEIGRQNGFTGGGGASLNTPVLGFALSTRSVDDLQEQILGDGGAFVSSTQPAATVNTAMIIPILALNRSGSIITMMDANLAFASLGNALSLSQAISYRTAMNAFQTTLGRNV